MFNRFKKGFMLLTAAALISTSVYPASAMQGKLPYRLRVRRSRLILKPRQKIFRQKPKKQRLYRLRRKLNRPGLKQKLR